MKKPKLNRFQRLLYVCVLVTVFWTWYGSNLFSYRVVPSSVVIILDQVIYIGFAVSLLMIPFVARSFHWV